MYLGVQAIRRRRALAAVLDAAALPRSGRRLLGEGFVVGIANPKAIIFLAAILPQFVARDGGPAGLQMLVLGLIFLLLALVCDSTWAVAAGSARNALAASPHRLERMGGAGGLRDDRPRRPPGVRRPGRLTTAERAAGDVAVAHAGASWARATAPPNVTP